MDVYSACASLNNSSDLLTPVVQDAVLVKDSAVATWKHQQEVTARLMQYCAFYEAEIARQEERISDIMQALDNLLKYKDDEVFVQKARATLHVSLGDAQNCLNEAKLAKHRFEMELGRWPTTESVPATARDEA
ncbi:hypothetical protein H4218_000518 [Coemansia sp. IMI 209128]|nr:hypothetical protein GGI10_003150 [Coemansia sp. RSA 2530]KAJ2703020.1 hypothetical protein H4218_000518 [Coemansia sp. IMI 209128]